MRLAVLSLALAGMGLAQRVNYAKYQSVRASSINGTYHADLAVDGHVSGFHSFRTAATGPHWLEISYPREVVIGSMHVYGGEHAGDVGKIWVNFHLEYHDGAGWYPVSGSQVVGNQSAERNLLLPEPVTASRFRLVTSDTGNRILREWAMFPPRLVDGMETGYPLGTDVSMSLAHQRPATASSHVSATQSPGFAKLAVDGHVSNDSRWLCQAAAGSYLEIDLLAEHRIGSAHLYSGFLNEQGQWTDVLSDFTLLYQSGGDWLPIPGASLSGNTQSAVVIPFDAELTTARVRLVCDTATAGRVAELLLFPPRPGGFPLGQDVVMEPPPADSWERFSDHSWGLRSDPATGTDRRLGMIGGSVVYAGGGAGDAALRWQLLLNHRDGSYRIRHVDSGLCLAQAGIRAQAPIPVVVESYSALPHQDWRLEPVAGKPNQFRIRNVFSGLALQTQGSWNQGTPMIVAQVQPDLAVQHWRVTANPLIHPKKGIAATHSSGSISFEGRSYTWMEWFHLHHGVGASWSYSWGRQKSDVFPFMGHRHAFQPMQWGNFNFTHGSNQGPLEILRGDLQSNPRPVHLMGFNEPDGAGQANMTVDAALSRWPRLEAMHVPLVSPGPVNAPNAWLDEFIERCDGLGYRNDAISMHWYKAPSSAALINDMQTVYQRYGRPVWLTEFSAVRWSGNATWTHADNYHFLAEFLWRAQSLPWLKRYALFHFRENASGPNQDANDPAAAPRSNSLRADGSLTAFGELYSTWDEVAEIRQGKAYHVHNRGRYERMRHGGGAEPPGFVPPEDSGEGTQWFFLPGDAVGTVRLASGRDGRELASPDGVVLSMVPVGVGGSGEWRLVAVSSSAPDGWFYLEHPPSNRRLRHGGSGGFGLVAMTHTAQDSHWRFIVPRRPGPVAAPPAPTGLGARAEVGVVTLAWQAAEGAAAYRVLRARGAQGPWQTLADQVVEPFWRDEDLQPEEEWHYQVVALNGLGESPGSDVITAAAAHPWSDYGTWVADRLAGRPEAMTGQAADPDGDGWNNLLEYAILSDPAVAQGNALRLEPGGADRIVMIFPWNHRAAGHTWKILANEDLASGAPWSGVRPEAVELTRDGDRDWIRVTLPITDSRRGFFVIEVTAP
jgi:hypothetical protein